MAFNLLQYYTIISPLEKSPVHSQENESEKSKQCLSTITNVVLVSWTTLLPERFLETSGVSRPHFENHQVQSIKSNHSLACIQVLSDSTLTLPQLVLLSCSFLHHKEFVLLSKHIMHFLFYMLLHMLLSLSGMPVPSRHIGI